MTIHCDPQTIGFYRWPETNCIFTGIESICRKTQISSTTWSLVYHLPSLRSEKNPGTKQTPSKRSHAQVVFFLRKNRVRSGTFPTPTLTHLRPPPPSPHS